MFSIFVFFILSAYSSAATLGSKDNGCVDFIALGDWGVDNQAVPIKVAEAMAKYASENPVDFIVTSGDNFYPDGVNSEDDFQFDYKWRDVYNQQSIKDLTWYITVGNHDYGNSGSGVEHNQVTFGNTEPRWNFPQLYYSFTKSLGNDKTVKFIMVDSQGFRRKQNNYLRQRAFVQEEIRNPADWTIVIFHHPFYNVGGHTGSETMLREVLIPIINDGGRVDMVIAGHDHNLQHMSHRNGTNTQFYVSGGGGARLYALNEEKVEVLRRRGVDLEYFKSSHGFSAIHICDDEATVKFIDDDGEEIYSNIQQPRKYK
ncbi:DgyrCDS7127 [Dimorphilus gyrociliatus]|uniref:DgyrCDS7127 n=1 Tax=Dimorphilus gyrociliatus TaxID=2664684 RepID=A0A7I8VSR8_9ANNE|nr:DgyrCDS7127 [Dimorphilus gyrociliatus]